VPRLGDYFMRSPFRARFERKGRFSDYLAAVPTYVIGAANPALRGLATLFRDDQASAC
jgi:glucokinase